MARLLDGKACSKEIEAELKESIAALPSPPKVSLVLVGDDQASKTYIRLKKNACNRVGITPDVHELPASSSFEDVHSLIVKLNTDSSVHGILLQLPLPGDLHEHEEELLESVVTWKDVDALHATHFAQLGKKPVATAQSSSSKLYLQPCTPAGCLELLDRNNVDIEGKDVVVIGRSQLVGLPLSLLMLRRNATVTTCHTSTKDLYEKVARADIVVVAAGAPEFIPGDWLQPGAVVVDVGMNYVDDADSKKGYRVCGDVHFASASERASAITPVPGGIGPMTIAMLLVNTVKCATFAQSADSIQSTS